MIQDSQKCFYLVTRVLTYKKYIYFKYHKCIYRLIYGVWFPSFYGSTLGSFVFQLNMTFVSRSKASIVEILLEVELPFDLELLEEIVSPFSLELLLGVELLIWSRITISRWNTIRRRITIRFWIISRSRITIRSRITNRTRIANLISNYY